MYQSASFSLWWIKGYLTTGKENWGFELTKWKEIKDDLAIRFSILNIKILSRFFESNYQ